MPFLLVGWMTMDDEGVCLYCRPLHNQVKIFKTGQDEFPPIPCLSLSPIGEVWDMITDKSIVHERHGIKAKCRCHLEYTVWTYDMTERIIMLQGKAEAYKTSSYANLLPGVGTP